MKKILFSLLLGIFLISLVTAVPQVTTTQQFEEGYIIINTPQTYIRQYADYNVNFFVYNSSNGLAITDSTVNCTYFLANSSGDLLFSQNATYSNGYWSLLVNRNNFSYTGEYFYGIECLSSTHGGQLSGNYQVTSNGFIGSMNFYLLLILFSLGFIILGLSIKDAPITILGSIGLYFLGLYTLFYGFLGLRDSVYSWGLGIVILGIAFYISTKSAHELITN